MSRIQNHNGGKYGYNHKVILIDSNQKSPVYILQELFSMFVTLSEFAPGLVNYLTLDLLRHLPR